MKQLILLFFISLSYLSFSQAANNDCGSATEICDSQPKTDQLMVLHQVFVLPVQMELQLLVQHVLICIKQFGFNLQLLGLEQPT